MNTRLYVGNLPYSASESDIRAYFEKSDTKGDAKAARRVKEVKIITDRDTGRPRGFAFVEMETPQMAESAIADLHSKEFGGRTIVVNHAHARDGGASRGGSESRSRAPRE